MVGIYARVSTEEQARSGFSLQDQLRECRRKAASDEVREYIDEGISGEVLDRPALTRLRDDVRSGIITRVICLDPDRLSRKLMHQLLITEEFDKRGVELLFVNGDYAKTPEGTLFYSLRGAIAEFEKAKINERMSRGRREKARQGKVLRDFQIYGYDYNPEQEQLVINETEAAVVRRVFSLFIRPTPEIQGISGIARYLTDSRIPTKRGAAVWHRQVVRQILANRTYIGEFYQNRWNTEGMAANKHRKTEERQPLRPRPQEEWIRIPCPPIIDRETFEQAQRRLEAARRLWAGNSTRRYLLSGLIRCGSCGAPLSGRQSHHWGRNVRIYAEKRSGDRTSCGRQVKCAELDRQVWETIRSWLLDPQELAKAARQDRQTDLQASERSRLERERERVRAARRRLLHLYATAPVSAEQEVQEALREWEEKERTLEQQITELQREHSGLTATASLEQAVSHYLREQPDQLTEQDKHHLIRLLVRQVIVHDGTVEIITY